ncbi:ESPR domain-containing protein, partial [Psychrobacter sp. YGAH215]|uniref:ESPR domain-containing protein n=1 Tax=Psychrobacter sp. YGAH215 TaxID=2596826 RepID=UPI0021E0B852
MNRNYKVIWNASLNCFMAVAEYAKSRGKSSSGAVTSSTTVTSGSVVASGTNILRWSALCTGMIAAGFSMQAIAANYDAGGGAVRAADGIAIGSGAISGTTTPATRESIAIGHLSSASGDQSVALGANTRASGNSSVAIGGDDIDKIADNVTKNDAYQEITGVRLIRGNVSGGSYRGTSGEGAGASAFGVQALAKGDFSTALGMTSLAEGAASVALGVNSKATEKGALAIGAVSSASGVGSVALGINSKSSGLNSIAIGSGSTPTTGANASGENATSIGSQSTAAANATAIGSGAKANIAGGVAIGTGSVANTAAGIKGFDPSTGGATNKTSNVWVSTRAAVALGDSATGITRQLTGLAAGTNDSDAVNVAQLNTLTNQTFKIQANNDTASAVKSSDTVKFKNGSNVEITRSGNDITIATSSNPSFTTVTSTGAMSAGSLNTGGALTVAGVATLNGGANLNNKKISGLAIGTELTDAANVGQLQAATNGVTNTAPVVYTKADGTQVYKVGSAFFDNAAGTGTAVANADIITSIRSADGSTTRTTKLRNVAAGSIATNSTEAINGSQLNNIAQSNKTLLGGAAAVDVNGVVTSTNIGGTGASTIDGAISAANTQANKELTFTGNVLSDTGTNGSQQKLGSTLNISGGAATTATSSNANIKTVITDGKVDIQIVDAPTFTGQVKANGFDANSQKIVNVANGATTSGSKDAINGGQLNTTAGSIASHLGGGATYNATTGAITAPSYQLDK